jgi:hypothetical protein
MWMGLWVKNVPHNGFWLHIYSNGKLQILKFSIFESNSRLLGSLGFWAFRDLKFESVDLVLKFKVLHWKNIQR